MSSLLVLIAVAMACGCAEERISHEAQLGLIQAIDKGFAMVGPYQELDAHYKNSFLGLSSAEKGLQVVAMLRTRPSMAALKLAEEGKFDESLHQIRMEELEKALITFQSVLLFIKGDVIEAVPDTREVLRIRRTIDDGLRRLKRDKQADLTEAAGTFQEVLQGLRTQIMSL